MISVIIPAYNAADFLERAVKSALEQKETGEVILIEDGSTDNTLEICRELESRHKKVSLVQHSGNLNKGPSASRNLGVKASAFDLVAFLDADDYYLQDRFGVALPLLQSDPDIDGVYEAIAPEFLNDDLSQAHELKKGELMTVVEPVPPEDLFFEMSPIGRKGFFSGDGLLVKKDLFIKAGGYEEEFRIGEDQFLWMKMSVIGKLVAGQLDKPVTMYMRHGANTTRSEKVDQYLIPVYQRFLDWGKGIISRKHIVATLDSLMYVHINQEPITLRRKRQLLGILNGLGIKDYKFLFSKYYWYNLIHILKA